MPKNKVKKKIFEYFKNNSIQFRFLNEESRPILFDSSDTVYLCAEVPDVIGEHIETCLRFKENHLYCQSYYCQPVVSNEEQAIRAARMVNYLNMNLNYDCNSLYEHSFILDENHGDIFNGSLIRYELLEEYFYETMDHILNLGVQQLVDVSPFLIGYILGVFPYDYATKVGIDHKIIGKPRTESDE